MMRLPPTSLVLSSRDVREYGTREEQGRRQDNSHRDPKQRRIFGVVVSETWPGRSRLEYELLQDCFQMAYGQLSEPSFELLRLTQGRQLRWVMGSDERVINDHFQREQLYPEHYYDHLTSEQNLAFNEDITLSRRLWDEGKLEILNNPNPEERAAKERRFKNMFKDRTYSIKRYWGIQDSLERVGETDAPPMRHLTMDGRTQPLVEDSELHSDGEEKDLSSHSSLERENPEMTVIRARSQGIENNHPVENALEHREGLTLPPIVANEIDEEGYEAPPPYTESAESASNLGEWPNQNGLNEGSKSIGPDNTSTPTRPHIFDPHRLHPRGPLPRSPLFFSQHPSSSPERPPTATSVPRNDSRDAPRIVRNNQSPTNALLTSSLSPRLPVSGTPRILFSHPARRHRSYRPRTISYSYEESERASYAYEQPHNSDSGSADDDEDHHEVSTLHVELRGRQLRDSSMDSAVQSSPPVAIPTNAMSALPGEQEIFYDVSEEMIDSLSASPQLPPPFSAGNRTVTTTLRMPSASIREPDSLAQTSIPHRYMSRESRQDITRTSSPVNEDSSPTSSESRQSNMLSLPLRIVAAYRDRSPVGHRATPSPTTVHSPIVPQRSLQQYNHSPPANTGASAPRRSLRVYNDDIAASYQPQTPAHLPDARHRSRFHPSYTAPTERFTSTMRQSYSRGSPRSVQSVRARRATTTGRSRSDSPAGMNTPGFEGLYGGIENGDEQALFFEAERPAWLHVERRRRTRSRSGVSEEGELTLNE